MLLGKRGIDGPREREGEVLGMGGEVRLVV